MLAVDTREMSLFVLLDRFEFYDLGVAKTKGADAVITNGESRKSKKKQKSDLSRPQC